MNFKKYFIISVSFMLCAVAHGQTMTKVSVMTAPSGQFGYLRVMGKYFYIWSDEPSYTPFSEMHVNDLVAKGNFFNFAPLPGPMWAQFLVTGNIYLAQAPNATVNENITLKSKVFEIRTKEPLSNVRIYSNNTDGVVTFNLDSAVVSTLKLGDKNSKDGSFKVKGKEIPDRVNFQGATGSKRVSFSEIIDTSGKKRDVLFIK